MDEEQESKAATDDWRLSLERTLPGGITKSREMRDGGELVLAQPTDKLRP